MQLTDPRLFHQKAYINGQWLNAQHTIEVTTRLIMRC